MRRILTILAMASLVLTAPSPCFHALGGGAHGGAELAAGTAQAHDGHALMGEDQDGHHHETHAHCADAHQVNDGASEHDGQGGCAQDCEGGPGCSGCVMVSGLAALEHIGLTPAHGAAPLAAPIPVFASVEMERDPPPPRALG